MNCHGTSCGGSVLSQACNNGWHHDVSTCGMQITRYLMLLSVATGTKSNLGQKKFTSVYRLCSIMQRIQDRNLEAATEVGTMEEHSLLPGLLWLAQVTFLSNPNPPMEDGAAHKELGPPSSVKQFKKMPHKHANRPV